MGVVVRLAHASNLNLEWLATGEGPMRKEEEGQWKGEGAIPGYPEITPLVVLRVLSGIEAYYREHDLLVDPGKLHKLLLVVCKRLVERKRGGRSGDVTENMEESDEFMETVALLRDL